MSSTLSKYQFHNTVSSSMKVKITQLCPTLWNSPGQNTGAVCLSLLQRLFMTQELNWGLLHCGWILYQLSYQGSPLSTVTIIYIRSSDFIHVITEILYTLTSSYFSCILPSPSCPTGLVLGLLFWCFF